MDKSTQVCGTCAVCMGTFMVHGQSVVLHGYKRPGDGEIRGRCYGEKRLAWEISPEAAVWYLENILRPMHVRAKEWLRALQSNEVTELNIIVGYERAKLWGVMMAKFETIGRNHMRWELELVSAVGKAINEERTLAFEVRGFEKRIAEWKLGVLQPVVSAPKHMEVMFDHNQLEWKATPIGGTRTITRSPSLDNVMLLAKKRGWSLPEGTPAPKEIVPIEYLKECASRTGMRFANHFRNFNDQPYAAQIALNAHARLSEEYQARFNRLSLHSIARAMTWRTHFTKSMKIDMIAQEFEAEILRRGVK